MRCKRSLLIVLPLVFLAACSHIEQRPGARPLSENEKTLDGSPPLIIAHRGASGYLPEHTLAAYERAVEMGADFIEPDLVVTKDGYLIARHENEFSSTSDVAERYPNRKTTKEIEGRKVSGWFTEDFTLAEIRSVRARERLSFRPQEFNGKFAIPTLQEVLALVRRMEKKFGRKIGVYPELKHPTFFRKQGLPLEDRLLMELGQADFSPDADLVFIQSFEAESLKELAKKSRWKLVQLLERDSFLGSTISDAKLNEIRTYAAGIGPDKRLILPEGLLPGLSSPTDLVKRAHAAGLFVHAYTFRSERNFLAAVYNDDPEREYFDFFALGVDGVFSDFSDQAVRARERFLARNSSAGRSVTQQK